MPILWGILSAVGGWLSQQVYKTFWIISIIAVVFFSLWLFGVDLFTWVVLKLLDLASYLLAKFNVTPESFDFMAYARQFTPEIKGMADLLGFSEILRNILLAISLRFAIDLIPLINRVG